MHNMSLILKLLYSVHSSVHAIWVQIYIHTYTKDTVLGRVDLPVKSLQLYLPTEHIQELV